jgi:hypothetical protein
MRSAKCEVFRPLVTARVKKNFDAACQGIDSTKIRSLVEITTMACQRKVIDIIGNSMLPGSHVLNVMQEFAIALVKSAILTSIASPFTDEPPGSGIHR